MSSRPCSSDPGWSLSCIAQPCLIAAAHDHDARSALGGTLLPSSPIGNEARDVVHAAESGGAIEAGSKVFRIGACSVLQWSEWLTRKLRRHPNTDPESVASSRCPGGCMCSWCRALSLFTNKHASLCFSAKRLANLLLIEVFVRYMYGLTCCLLDYVCVPTVCCYTYMFNRTVSIETCPPCRKARPVATSGHGCCQSCRLQMIPRGSGAPRSR